MKTFTPKFEILPTEQVALWPQLRPISELGFILYGGTSIALRLGHRRSVDFDFFTSGPVDRTQLRKVLPFLSTSQVLQDKGEAFEVITAKGVKVAFFGALDFGHLEEPERSEDGVVVAASLNDLMAHKLKVILQRSEAKDYQDIAALFRAGLSVAQGLASAEWLFHPAFPIQHSLRALTYFEDGDLERLNLRDRADLVAAAKTVKLPLPEVRGHPGLGACTWVHPE
ncbi:MAG: nucleotidyl transferase AbiEii/AbiGii toxin family protein [Verrucomicrobia bacterium]|nr:nucleotidyl transferase AbiEii/AbiGii toxin family protein [Verrucomicrobiota bacterium]